MWRLAFAALPLAALILARAVGGIPSQADTPTPTTEPSPSPSSSPSSVPASATPEPLPPAPETTPSAAPPDPKSYAPLLAALDPAYTGPLRPGDWVQVTGTDSCLNVRSDPRLPVPLPDGQTYDNVLNCLPDGFVGWLDGSVSGDKTSLPVNAEGRWWWRITGQGWAAEEWLTFHHQGGFPWPERPDLASSGLIAYIRSDNSIWLMNADGSNQRQIVSGGQNQYIQSLQWAPSGDRLALSVHNWDGAGSFFTTRLVDLNGNGLAEFTGISEPLWSPDGRRLSGIRVQRNGDLGGYYGTPIVFDLATASEWAVGPENYYMTAPAWSLDGSSLAFVCTSTYVGQPDGTFVVDEERSCGGDGLRIVSADGASARVVISMDPLSGFYLSNPSWSADGGTIALVGHQDVTGCRGYSLVSVYTGVAETCIALPPTGGMGGGCGGSAETGASDWSPDGRTFVFHAQGAGQSGVFVHDIATGERSIIPNMMAESVTIASSGDHLAFGGSGYIWVAGPDGSNLTLLAEGHSPAWQPQP